MLGFGPVRIEPGETARVVARPQMLFKGTRLAYVGPARTFVLTNIQVGWNSQLAGSVETPMESFPPLPAGLASVSDWLNNCGISDRAQPGMDITLVIQNVSRTSAEFSAVLFGDINTEI
jgi:hypothetical protein